MRGRHLLLALCASFGAVPLAAQDSGQTITVTGEREDSEAERRREGSTG